MKEIRTKYNAEATRSSAGVIGAQVVMLEAREPLRVMTIYKNETLDLDSGVRGKIPLSNVPHVQEHAPTQESLAAQRHREEHLEKASEAARGAWVVKAKKGDFDSVVADLEVYKYSDQKVTKDPRRSPEYRKQVVDELKFGMDADTKEPHRRQLSDADKALCVDVFTRKAAAFHLDGTPRTTVRKVLHDCIPTGPPVRTPPHNLKGVDAQWTAHQLEDQIKTGQLTRGNSAWGSPPFPTKDFPGHKKARKRRLVVDYRRVNLRTMRAIYYVRRASDILVEAMGSVWYSLLDAVAGFNQIVNTQRAREMLAIVAHTGTFLPRCLTFGPHNGPEDFAFVTDRVFSPGKGQKRRFCKEWLAYVDDLTIRTGRVVDGKFWTDTEHEGRISTAARKVEFAIQAEAEAFAAAGYSTEGLGIEVKTEPFDSGTEAITPTLARKKTKKELAKVGLTTAAGTGACRSPFAHFDRVANTPRPSASGFLVSGELSCCDVNLVACAWRSSCLTTSACALRSFDIVDLVVCCSIHVHDSQQHVSCHSGFGMWPLIYGFCSNSEPTDKQRRKYNKCGLCQRFTENGKCLGCDLPLCDMCIPRGCMCIPTLCRSRFRSFENSNSSSGAKLGFCNPFEAADS